MNDSHMTDITSVGVDLTDSNYCYGYIDSGINNLTDFDLDEEIRAGILTLDDFDTDFTLLDTISDARDMYANIKRLQGEYREMSNYFIDTLPAKPRTMFLTDVSIDFSPSIFDEINDLQPKQQSHEIGKLHQNVVPERICLSWLSLEREILNEKLCHKMANEILCPTMVKASIEDNKIVTDFEIIKINKLVPGTDYIIQHETVRGTEIASVTETIKRSQNDGVDRYEVRKGSSMGDKVEMACREASVARKLKDQLWLQLLIFKKIQVKDQSFSLEYSSLEVMVKFSKNSLPLNYKKKILSMNLNWLEVERQHNHENDLLLLPIPPPLLNYMKRKKN